MKLNEPLSISIRGEGEPFFLYPGDRHWTPATLSSMSYGYAVKVTPLQTLTFYNAVANSGKMVKPRFVTEVRNRGKIEKTFPPEVINPSICSKATLKMARKMLEGVVETGTASSLRSNMVSAAGKTGTTKIFDRYTGYSRKSHQASFAGYFPADNPRYSCIVVVYSPKGDRYHGSDVAAPAFFEIASKVYTNDVDIHIALNDQKEDMTEIPYSKNGFLPELQGVLTELDIDFVNEDAGYLWAATEKKEDHVNLHEKKMIGNLVPDVVSMGLKDAVYLLENLGLHVKVVGRGSVRHQSLPPGSRIVPGQTIRLEMSFIEG
jgi:cell division protein FtsI (penicillin-binding protein 3)